MESFPISYVFTDMCGRVHTCIHVRVHGCMHGCVYMHSCKFVMYVMGVYICMYVWVYVCMYVFMHVCSFLRSKNPISQLVSDDYISDLNSAIEYF